MDRPGRDQQPMVRRALEVGFPMKIHNGIRYIRPMLADWPLYPVGLRWLAIMMEMAIDAAVWNAELGICEVALGSGDRLVPSGHWLCESGAVDWKALTGDFDGDGRHDLFYGTLLQGKPPLLIAPGVILILPNSA